MDNITISLSVAEWGRVFKALRFAEDAAWVVGDDGEGAYSKSAGVFGDAVHARSRLASEFAWAYAEARASRYHIKGLYRDKEAFHAANKWASGLIRELHPQVARFATIIGAAKALAAGVAQ